MILPRISNVKEGALRLLFPRRCPLCDGLLSPKEELVCTGCAGIAAPEPDYFPGGFAPFVYEDEYRDSVLRFKYKGRAEYAPFYAKAIADAGGDLIRSWGPQVIIPVPIHRRRLMERGYNQAAELAKALSATLKIPDREDVVVRTRDTRPQNRLDADDRRANVKGAFRVRRADLVPRRVLIVDDIYTTGSTISELARVLEACGCEEVHAACVCRAVLP